MPDRFAEIESFVKIAESGTLSEAARRLGLSLAATSRRLSQLEARLGVMLIRRNSRHLSLTEEGSLLYDRAGRALSAIDDVETDVMRRATEATGLLRVVTTIGAARMRLAPLFRHYAALHPDVAIHLETAAQATNIVETGHDIAICFDPPPDSALTMKRLTDNPRLLCAAPAYLNRRGHPGAVGDLSVHDNIVVGEAQQELWRSVVGSGNGPRVTLSTNDGDMARAWALDGAGIVIKSLWEVADDLDAGRLQQLLPDVALPAASIVALYVPGQGETAKVRSCLDFLSRHLKKGWPVSPADRATPA
ncbi:MULTISPECIES: LysR family transcriptional regulator [Sphingobium]|uniref:LysR family transcriptional regulator n=1 Tax=Sphingobium cupriresistens LL01 TaxID=1420583 RepID=A0A0J7XU82_9SPHN|nr:MULTISPECIES: LysR family transcriptional regulator [Sphingobium]KMS54598.1 LysR family transcriptional regulator [Sphingobium cupriresistens LL01]WCP13022.1 HTH-type transcriptional regulator DmlR [Sphingobium sp. AntQ-1]